MARLRTIKPGFFSNDVLAEVPMAGRLLFIGLWCIADREGRLEDRPKRIKVEVLPYDDVDVNALLDALAARSFILRYTARGNAYIQIVNFAKHQSPHVKEAPSTIPAPDSHDASPEKASASTPSSGKWVVGSGNLGVGSDEDSAAAAPSPRESAPTLPARETSAPSAQTSAQATAEAAASSSDVQKQVILAALRADACERFPLLSAVPTRDLDALFRKHLRRGLTDEDLHDQLARLAASPSKNGQSPDYARLASWLQYARHTDAPKPGPGGGGNSSRSQQRPEPPAPRLTRFDAVPPLASESPRGAQTSPDPTPPSAAAPPRPTASPPSRRATGAAGDTPSAPRDASRDASRGLGLVERRAPYAVPGAATRADSALLVAASG